MAHQVDRCLRCLRRDPVLMRALEDAKADEVMEAERALREAANDARSPE